MENQFKSPQDWVICTEGHDPLYCSLATEPWRRSKKVDMVWHSSLPSFTGSGHGRKHIPGTQIKGLISPLLYSI
jgi:hypothetical protein